MTNLTPEEHDVLVLAAAGFLAKQIAAIMGQRQEISDSAINRRLDSTRNKLEAKNITQAYVIGCLGQPEDAALYRAFVYSAIFAPS